MSKRQFLPKSILPLLLAVSVSGCEVPVMVAAANNDAALSGVTRITFPASMLLDVSGQDEVIYAGEMFGYASGAADIALTSPDGRSCAGRMTAQGTGEMTCDDVVIALSREAGERQSMSGTVYRSGTLIGVAYAAVFGWGKGAQEPVLRQSMGQKRSLGGKEARDLAPNS